MPEFYIGSADMENRRPFLCDQAASDVLDTLRFGRKLLDARQEIVVCCLVFVGSQWMLFAP